MIELEQIKDYLGITGTSDDTRLQSILDGVNSLVISAIGDYEEGEKTIQIKNKIIKDNKIGLLHVNPTEINEINGNDFSGKVNGVDYMILNNGEVIIKNLCDFISNDFGVFEVKYNAGYTDEDIPKDLIASVGDYVGYLFSQDLGKNVIKEKTGPREVGYESSEGISGSGSPVDLQKSKFLKSLTKYIPLHLRVWG